MQRESVFFLFVYHTSCRHAGRQHSTEDEEGESLHLFLFGGSSLLQSFTSFILFVSAPSCSVFSRFPEHLYTVLTPAQELLSKFVIGLRIKCHQASFCISAHTLTLTHIHTLAHMHPKHHFLKQSYMC